VLVAGSATAVAWAYDHAHSGVILPGVAVGDVAVGGLTRAAAMTAVNRAVDPALDAPITVRVGARTETVTARQLGTGTDAEARVDAALASHSAVAFPVRLYHRITGNPLHQRERLERTVDRKVLSAYVAALARRVAVPAVDAAIDTTDGFVHVTPDYDGFGLVEAASTKLLRSALLRGDAVIDLAGTNVAPKTRAADLGLVVLVRVGENKLYLYRNGQMDKTFDVATGMPRYPTPLGQFKVVSRLKNPTWINPAKYPGGWGWTMPARIGPGRGNPLGSRALGLSANGVLIHGTSNSSSIGLNASHGCIRMRMTDVEALFELVPAGTPVVILRAAPDRIAPHQSAAITEPDVVAGPGAPPPTATTATSAPPATSTTTTTIGVHP
jgi:lipoprotein-anchoring transpeptidase ErfK/SrfK